MKRTQNNTPGATGTSPRVPLLPGPSGHDLRTSQHTITLHFHQLRAVRDPLTGTGAPLAGTARSPREVAGRTLR
eukprot:CAMPEP_0204252980 /NCGR_PEP_ID=MMETSP0468-20130131/1589_1 /ASSEMBLY_ACC=CAM_ASM_000383 /TAXON_ID=2969 /ORGANISM="Oxyrrhis marina" /LENGTH=73 /DNA_ID=CAMNT_0051226501 /DNA_START=39 /DNA_END=256 /DNA_ORIENTATION=-